MELITAVKPEAKMDPLHYPLVVYFWDWDNMRGTIVFGILGTLVFAALCALCVYQMRNLRDD